MNNELETKEYLKRFEQVKLSDSSRLRMREELLAHARFHAAPEGLTPKSVPSPFFNFFMRPASVAFAMVLLVGTTAFYFNKDNVVELAVVDESRQPTESTEVSNSPKDTELENFEESKINTPTPKTSEPTKLSQSDTDVIALNTRAKSAGTPEADSAAMASDEMFMTSELSAGTWSIAEHTADVTKRIEGLRAIIKKYDSKFEAANKTEFTTKLNTADTLKISAEGKSEQDARTNLDKASVLIGEIESALSLQGEVIVEDGYIVDIKL